MHFHKVLYLIAAIFISAAVSHYYTRASIAHRIASISNQLLIESEWPQNQQTKEIVQEIALRYRISTSAPCTSSFLLFIPGITSLYGAISSHVLTKKGKESKPLMRILEMAGIFVLLMFLAGAMIPC